MSKMFYPSAETVSLLKENLDLLPDILLLLLGYNTQQTSLASDT